MKYRIISKQKHKANKRLRRAVREYLMAVEPIPSSEKVAFWDEVQSMAVEIIPYANVPSNRREHWLWELKKAAT